MPDHTILWIARDDFGSLPESVLSLQSQGLEIRQTDDIKSYKKIIPALALFPGAYICTADDDVYYWSRWLEELVEGQDPNQASITCHRAHEITLGPSGKYLPYGFWKLDTPHRGTSSSIFPTGIGGILYSPGVLKYQPEDREALSTLCPNGDDIWLYWIGRRNRAAYRTVGYHREFVTWKGSQNQALWRANLLGGHNDAQIEAMGARYGYPTILDDRD